MGTRSQALPGDASLTSSVQYSAQMRLTLHKSYEIPMKLLTKSFWSACVMALAASSVDAKQPYVTYIFPAGAQRGTTVDVKVGGHYLHDSATLRFEGSGVEVPARIKRGSTVWFEGPVIPQPPSQRQEDYPVDYDATFKVVADASLGAREWSVSTAQGATVPMKFVIGNFPEYAEDEIDGKALPQLIPLPATINGRTFPREDVDQWSCDLQAGQTLTCLVTAQDIDSPVEAHLEIRDPSGKRVAEATGTQGQDPILRHVAKTTGRYVVQINDANFGGLQHYVYRLTLTTGPVVDSVFPLGGRRGETLKLQLQGTGLSQTQVDLPLPNDAEQLLYRPDFAASRELGHVLEITEHPEVFEPNTPNNDAASAASFTIPSVLNGRIEAPGDVDFWKIDAKKGDQLLFEVHASTLGSELDSVLTIYSADEKRLVEADDNGQDIDAKQVFNVPTDGTYFVKISHRIAKRGGPQFGYRLHALDAKTADSAPFTLEVQTQQRAVSVDRDGELQLKLNVRRQNFNEAIDLVLEGLPAGVTVEGDTVAAKQNNATIKLKADAKTPLAASVVRVIGKAKINDVERQSVATIRTNPPTPEKIDRLMVAVTVKTPFKFFGAFESKFAPRGSVYFRHYSIDRGGYEGPLEVSLADRQNRHLQGVTGQKIVVPAGANEFDYPVNLPPWLEVGRTSRTCLMAVGEVVDPDGTKHKVTFTSQEQNDQIIVLTAPEEFSVQIEIPAVRAVPGESVNVPLQVGRASHLRNPAVIEVVPAKHIKGVVTEPVTVPAESSKATLKVAFEKGPLGPFNVPLLIRAKTMDDRGQPVVYETSLEVVCDIEPAPVVQARKTAK